MCTKRNGQIACWPPFYVVAIFYDHVVIHNFPHYETHLVPKRYATVSGGVLEWPCTYYVYQPSGDIPITGNIGSKNEKKPKLPFTRKSIATRKSKET